MFIGHFGIGLGAKKIAPSLSLGTLFFAAQFIDLLWPSLLMLGVEQVRIEPGASGITPLAFEHYPYSHSLLMVVVWGLLLAGAHFQLWHERRSAILLGVLVLSHWLLDLLVHAPDLPLFPGDSPRLGLGLWDSLTLTLAVEGSLFAIGALLYLRNTRPRDGQGRWGLIGLFILLVIIQAGSLFGNPPPGTTAIAWLGQAQWLLVLWAYWVDRHRMPKSIWFKG